MLLGLVREDGGVAKSVLTNLNVSTSKVRTAVEFIIGRSDRPIKGEVGFTPRAKRVIELAMDEARRLGHNYIGTEHLLLGLIREGEGIAAGILESMGVNLDKVRHETIRVLAGQDVPKPTVDTRPQVLVIIHESFDYLSDEGAEVVVIDWRPYSDVVPERSDLDDIRSQIESLRNPFLKEMAMERYVEELGYRDSLDEEIRADREAERSAREKALESARQLLREAGEYPPAL